MKYHAHIYWNNSKERAIAISLQEELQKLGCPLGRVHDTPIGPHTLAMYQAVYDDSNKAAVEKYLTANANGISILLHEDTGDDIHDHTDGVRWINKELPIDIVWLETFTKYKAKKDGAIIF